MFEVVYCSSLGNTRKVAEAIAAQLGVTAKDIKTAGVLPLDAFIFLGTGCYRGELPGELKAFLRKNMFPGRKIALFTTSVFGFEVERGKIKEQVEDSGAVIVRNFSCYGRLLDINKEHPTWLDLKKAAWFARSAALTIFTPQLETAEFVTAVV
jgi:flavodoxin